MNGTCFQDPIGFIKFSISPEFVPLLMDKDLLHKIFVSLRGIKQELYAKGFQVNDILPRLKTHVVNLKLDAKDLSRDLQRLEVRSKLESKTLYSTVVTSVVWHVLPSVERRILPEFAAYQIITSLKYGSLKGSGVNSLHHSI